MVCYSTRATLSSPALLTGVCVRTAAVRARDVASTTRRAGLAKAPYARRAPPPPAKDTPPAPRLALGPRDVTELARHWPRTRGGGACALHNSRLEAPIADACSDAENFWIFAGVSAGLCVCHDFFWGFSGDFWFGTVRRESVGIGPGGVFEAGERGVSERMSTIDTRLRKNQFSVNNPSDLISIRFCAIYCAMTKTNIFRKFYQVFSKD